jgi:hypothetical protein
VLRRIFRQRETEREEGEREKNIKNGENYIMNKFINALIVT